MCSFTCKALEHGKDLVFMKFSKSTVGGGEGTVLLFVARRVAQVYISLSLCLSFLETGHWQTSYVSVARVKGKNSDKCVCGGAPSAISSTKAQSAGLYRLPVIFTHKLLLAYL